MKGFGCRRVVTYRHALRAGVRRPKGTRGGRVGRLPSMGCESAPNRDPASVRVTTLIRRRESAEREGPGRRRQGPHHDADYWHWINVVAPIASGVPVGCWFTSIGTPVQKAAPSVDPAPNSSSTFEW